MTFLNSLYKIFLGPLELLFEVIFVIANKVIGNPGYSIIVLSLVMNFLVLPLYKRADAMQEEQRDTENRLKKWVTHIKKTFKGDERFMMLQTYYRQNNYKPTSILKGSVSLLLEIPFFIAAYNFLSHAGIFDGFSFGIFNDFGKPDGLIKIGSFSINLLPILMTTINIVSSLIYTKGLPTSSKVQLYGMAGIFLVLLYDSPAALVFYWTLNNLFSLVKNIFYKLKSPKFVFSIISSICGIILLFIILFIRPLDTPKKQLVALFTTLLLQLPIIFFFVRKYNKKKSNLVSVAITKNDSLIFYLGLIFFTIILGAFIPSTIINSSPEEFINTYDFTSPLFYILNSTLIALGTFCIWFTIFYKLSNNTGKILLKKVIWICAICGLVNYLFFGKHLGNLSPTLVFDKMPEYSLKQHIINLLVLLVIGVLAYFLISKKDIIVKYVYLSLIIGMIGLTTYNCIHINSVVSNKTSNLQKFSETQPHLTFSKNGKNVFVIMLDKAINSYVPFIFADKPEVAKQFEGFTYYPNTISFGGHTNFGAPALYGGYEYTTKEINKRDKETLESKMNESLKVMPVLFDNNGFNVTVCDPTYAGYDWIPDLTIYDEFPNIKKYRTMENGVGVSKEDSAIKKADKLNRNFFLFSLFKVSPLVGQTLIYNKGHYNSIKNLIEQRCTSLSTAVGISEKFLDSYLVLQNLPNLVTIDDSNKNSFIMMSNDTTHEPNMLQEPDYVPMQVVDNTNFDLDNNSRYSLMGRTMRMENTSQITHYHSNVAALIQLGNFFDFLRSNDLFDNTRIIIVADHGGPLNQFDDMIYGDSGDDVMHYNPLLMMKDFDSQDFTVDNSFMTNADVPTMAFDDLINNPINPFTNKLINSNPKYDEEKQYILTSHILTIAVNNGNKFIPGPWVSVHDNIFDMTNWEKIEGEY